VEKYGLSAIRGIVAPCLDWSGGNGLYGLGWCRLNATLARVVLERLRHITFSDRLSGIARR